MADSKRSSRGSTPVTSLLVNPPSSGFSWDPMGGGSFLMPVSQKEDDVDSFIGQTSSSTLVSSAGSISQPIREPSPHLSAFKPLATTSSSTGPGPLSQLQQPLRPLQQPEIPAVPPTFQPQAGPLHQSPVPPSEPPLMQNYHINAPQGAPPPPPTGPAQNFRRQTKAMAYAPTPGMQTNLPNANVYSQNQNFNQGGATGYQDPMSQIGNFSTASGPNYTSQYHPLPPPPIQSNSLEESSFYGAPSFTHQENVPGSTYVSSEVTNNVYSSVNNYKPVPSHWFYKKEVEKKEIWQPFTMIDCLNLEEAYKNGETSEIMTDGGRYSVNLPERLRKAVYWEENVSIVKRSSWFYRSEDNRYVPYDEVVADKIEEAYREGVIHNRWPQKVELEGVSEAVVMQNSKDISHYLPSKLPDEWGYIPGQMTLRVVKRGVNEILTVDEGEPNRIDHLVFLVQGVGAFCDLKFRSVVECVDDFRAMALNLMRSHYKGAYEAGRIGRVEFLPISWHASLHSTGIDKRMQTITLPSIPKLRNFTNDTLMDIFFYTSPVYCQTIVDTVGSEINRIYQIFLSRNPTFQGKVSVAGHSLGSLILFDILAHQLSHDRVSETPTPTVEDIASEKNSSDQESVTDTDISTLESLLDKLGLQEYRQKFDEELIDFESLKYCEETDIKEMGLPMGPRKKLLAHIKDLKEKELEKANAMAQSEVNDRLKANQGERLHPSQSQMSLVNRQDSIASVNYMVGNAGTGQPSVVYPKLSFHPSCFFALGSPIAMFLTVRGIQTIGEEYQLPTCPAFFNIFHPYDPVAFRLETLIDSDLTLKPVQIPHHKGRKRLHLELRDSLTRVGSDLKIKLMESLKYTWNSISEFARAHRSSAEQVEAEMDKVVQEQLAQQRAEMEETESTVSSATDIASQEDIQIGKLNGGRRIDYVLQEKPIESFNQYLFALASHTCYWESEDTALMIIKEVYHLDGVQPETPIPGANKVTLYNPAVIQQPHMPNPNLASYSNSMSSAQVPHFTNYQSTQLTTAPLVQSENFGQPPLQGFVKVSPLTGGRR